ncbi:hypothetical protein [Vibrio sp. CAU 1672]|uniref:hypothetical protein n=1 Tax=Vibrio sp. CAU 1672 TaxID=3032594 RepID=UPI0023D9FE9C|nr:hypothetical protein [Vibrio sp. CAU 1672]MDF2153030.1 hypothetical protein [Vibrio sp. CAU 1672]
MKVLPITALGIALLAGFYTPDIIQRVSSTSEAESLDDYCMLSTATCSQHGIAMTLSVDTAQPLVPARLEVQWSSPGAEHLVLSLQGLEMDMGEPRFILNHIDNHTYAGDVVLPVCTQNTMTWIGELSDGQLSVYPAIKMHR